MFLAVALGAPAFAQTRVQRAGNIGIRVEVRRDGGGVLAVIRRADASTPLGEDSRRVRELLGLTNDVTEFEIAYGLVPRKPNEVAVLTRSMMEIMLQLGFGIDLPAAHAAGKRALPGQVQADDKQIKPLVYIRSGVQEPADAYAAAPVVTVPSR